MKLVTVLHSENITAAIAAYFQQPYTDSTSVEVDPESLTKNGVLDYADVAEYFLTFLQNQPPVGFHQEMRVSWKSDFANFQALKTSEDNVLVVGQYDESCLILAYEGTRGRFLEEVSKLEASFPGIKNEINQIKPVEYATSGPLDMHPAECRSEYIIRKGGEALLKEVWSAMEKIDPEQECFGFGWFTPAGKREESHGAFFSHSSQLTANEGTVLEYWFNTIRGDEKYHLRMERIQSAKVFLASKLASGFILEKLISLI